MFKSRLLKLISASLLMLSLTACTQESNLIHPEPNQNTKNNDNNNNPSGLKIQELRSQKARASVNVPQGDLEDFYASQRAFAFAMYGQLAKDASPNVFYSPFSISQALSMLYVGAKGQTADEMKAALQIEQDPALVHQGWNALDMELASRGQGAQGSDGQPFRLNVANAIWVKLGFTMLDEFLDTLATQYDAGLKALNIAEDPDGARQIINKWVEVQTEDKIKDLLPQGSIQSSTALVLTNAIYFNAAWASPFEESFTKQGEFKQGDGTTASAEMMNQEQRFTTGVAEDGTRVLVMPYDGDELSMVVLMPEDGGLAKIEGALDEGSYESYLSAASSKHIQLSLPKFKTKTNYNLIPSLQALGMNQAFTGDADLSGINGTGGLYVSGVFHNAFISVNEAGTEAAAATAVIVGETSVPVVEDTVVIDRPFIFMIRDDATNVPLFIGRISQL